jgi:membrane-associated phospholipid phosphatase
MSTSLVTDPRDDDHDIEDRFLARPDGGAIRKFAIGFLLLVLLSTFWPGPVRLVSDLFFEAPLAVNEHSFLGREAPQWDVVFWWIAGMYALLILHGRLSSLREGGAVLWWEVRTSPRRLRETVRNLGVSRIVAGAALIGAVPVALAMWLDSPVVALLASLDQRPIWGVTTMINRFGGGYTPSLAAVFVGIVGLAWVRRDWIRIFLALLGTALVAGALLQVIKLLAGRIRPEAWLGALQFAPGRGESLPSGHTLSAFVVAGVLFFALRSRLVGWSLIVTASIVGLTRVLTFRHWPSDVVLSALVAVGVAWVMVNAVGERRRFPTETSEVAGRTSSE